MNELPTAAEKRRQYEAGENAKAQEEMRMVTAAINNATGTSVRLERRPSANVESLLKQKGYKCDYVQTGMNESDYEISW